MREATLEEIRAELDKMGVKISDTIVEWEADNGNQVYMRGPFAGASINSLAKYYAEQTKRGILVVSDPHL